MSGFLSVRNQKAASQQRSGLGPFAAKICKIRNLDKKFAASFTPSTTTNDCISTPNSDSYFGDIVANLEDFSDEESGSSNRATYNFQLGLINSSAMAKHVHLNPNSALHS